MSALYHILLALVVHIDLSKDPLKAGVKNYRRPNIEDSVKLELKSKMAE